MTVGELFQKVLDMSLVGCYSIFIVMAVRLLLLKCERKYAYWLWFAVFLNLCVPLSFQGFFSLIPSSVAEFSVEGIFDGAPEGEAPAGIQGEAIPPSPGEAWDGPGGLGMPAGMDGVKDGTVLPAENPAVGAGADGALRPSGTKGGMERRTPSLMAVATGVWLAGIALLLFISLVGSIRLQRQISREKWLRHNQKKGIAEVAGLDAPFLWGVLKPMIYLPADLEAEEYQYVVAHEQYHKRRKDHLVKMVFFLIAVMHWFNPFVWVAYSLFCRDMEISCDEAVLLKFRGDVKKQYAGSLLKYAARQSGFLLSPITFGEPAVKTRIKNVLRFKRRGVALTMLSMACVICVATGLVLRPLADSGVNEPEDEKRLDTSEDGSGPSGDGKSSDNDGLSGNGGSSVGDGEPSGIGTSSGDGSLLDGVAADDGSQNASLADGLRAVLLENGSFLSTDLQNQEFNVANIGKLLAADESVALAMKVNQYAIIDLDGDGEQEVVLSIQGGDNWVQGFEVLHDQAGTVYGSLLYYRAFMELKEDGTFTYSSGAAFSGVGKLRFAEDGSAVIEEYGDDLDLQDQKANVMWHDFSAGGVNTAYSEWPASPVGREVTGGEDWYGSYVVTDFVYGGVDALGAEAPDWVGYMVAYDQNEFDSNGATLENPIYHTTVVSKEEFEAGWRGSGGGYTFDMLGIEGDSLTEVRIEGSSSTGVGIENSLDLAFGSHFYVREDGALLLLHPGGVFFLAERY